MSMSEYIRLRKAINRRARYRITLDNYGPKAVKMLMHKTIHHFTLFLERESHNAGQESFHKIIQQSQ